MNGRSLIAAAALALALAGCGTPTPYQPGGGDGYGYTEQRIEQDRYRISFTASGATPAETVQNYLLYRAAEITLAQGGDYFVVTARSRTAEGYGGGRGVGTSVGVGGGSASGIGVGLGLGIPLGGGGGGPRTASVEIVIRSGPKPGGVPDAFDARDVRRSLGGLVRGAGP